MRKLNGNWKVKETNVRIYRGINAKIHRVMATYRVIRVGAYLFALTCALLLAPVYTCLCVLGKMAPEAVFAGYAMLGRAVLDGVRGTDRFF